MISWSHSTKMQSSYLLIFYSGIPKSEFLPGSVVNRAGTRVPGYFSQAKFRVLIRLTKQLPLTCPRTQTSWPYRGLYFRFSNPAPALYSIKPNILSV